jgi:hypothetical protein
MFRVLKISAALGIVGAVAGAVGACLALLLGVMMGKITTSTEVPFTFVTEAASLVGCACGLFVAPVLSWTLLRNVPLWRCATETAAATSFALIWAVTQTNDTWNLLAIAVLAAALAAARLKWEFRSRRAPEPDASA